MQNKKSMVNQIPNELITLVVAALLLTSIVPTMSAGLDDQKPVDALTSLHAVAEAIRR